jgi:L-asparagine transporter-like permease
MSGWLYWYFWVVVVAIEAIAGAQILHGWFPAIPELGIGIALMAILTAVNLMSARAYGEFEFWFSSIKVAAIIVFILVCAAWAFGLTSGGGSTFGNLTAHDGFVPNGWGVVLAAATSTIFSLVGAEIATIAAAAASWRTHRKPGITPVFKQALKLFWSPTVQPGGVSTVMGTTR